MAACRIQRDSPWVFDTRVGRDALDTLRERTRADPFFALASAVLHAGQVDYGIQQRVVDKLVADPRARQELRTKRAALAALRRVGTVQKITEMASRWPAAQDCWERNCGPDGAACVGANGKLPAAGNKLIDCMRDEVRGIGPKGRNLLAEYLGCDDAVAVDRHVANWLSSKAGTLAWAQRVYYPRVDSDEPCRRGWKRALRGPDLKPICSFFGRVRFVPGEHDAITRLRRKGIPAVGHVKNAPFRTMKREIHEMANRCNVPPAELQVAAWAQGACEGGRHGGRRESLHLMEGEPPYDCKNVPSVRAGPPPVGWPLHKYPPASTAKGDFRCDQEYLGRAEHARSAARVSGRGKRGLAFAPAPAVPAPEHAQRSARASRVLDAPEAGEIAAPPRSEWPIDLTDGPVDLPTDRPVYYGEMFAVRSAASGALNGARRRGKRTRWAGRAAARRGS